MSLAKRLARGALHGMGGLNVLRHRNRDRFRILMYHRFRPGVADQLHRQLTAFRRHYQVLSLGEIADVLDRNKPLPQKTLALTVDDGYRDFLENAFPVFQSLDVPATVYLVTDFLDRRCWLWTDRVACAVEQTSRVSFDITVGPRSLRFKLQTPAERSNAARTIIEAAKQLPNAQREDLVERLPGLLQVQLDAEPPAALQPLRWDEVRMMARHGIEFGAHTRSHPILSRIEENIRLRAEIEDSQRRIAEEIGSPVLHFCYPNGEPGDFTDAAVECVQQAGFRTAVTTTPGMNANDEPRFRLRRYGMEPESPLDYALERVEGLHNRMP
ncbi:MAG: polysaccharide deacetylase family protein [Acidobacteriota bacterium]